MNERIVETLGQRLDHLERENRRLKRAGVAALAVIAAVVLMGQATESKVAKVIEAEEFIVRDPDGKLSAKLTRHGLEMFDLHGTGTSVVRLTPVPGLSLGGKGTTPYPMWPSVVLLGKGGVGRATMAVTPDGSSALTLGAPMFGQGSERPPLSLWVSSDGDPTLSLSDENGSNRAVLGTTSLLQTRTDVVEKRPESSLVLFDKAGKVIWSAP